MSYKVYVDDNYHAMDESERYALGTYQTLAEAKQAAQDVVDNFLLEHYKPGVTAASLFAGYQQYGEDPFIVPADGSAVDFSAWGYAERRCQELCGS